MRFLGFYSALATLAVVGVCGVSQSAFAQDFDDDGYDNGGYEAVNPEGGADMLPPPSYVINAPLTYVDNGYNPSYSWNRDYAGYGYYAPSAYGVYPPVYGQGYYHTRARLPNWADDAGDYGASVAVVYPTYRGYPARWHHHHQARMRATPVRAIAHETPRWQAPHMAPAERAAAPERREHRGYNGHDAGMFPSGPRQ